MKLIFMGTPAFTLPVLEALQKEHEIVAIYTRAPKPAGHGMKIKKSPVHEWGERHQIPVLTPATLKSEEEQKKLSEENEKSKTQKASDSSRSRVR